MCVCVCANHNCTDTLDIGASSRRESNPGHSHHGRCDFFSLGVAMRCIIALPPVVQVTTHAGDRTRAILIMLRLATQLLAGQLCTRCIIALPPIGGDNSCRGSNPGHSHYASRTLSPTSNCHGTSRWGVAVRETVNRCHPCNILVATHAGDRTRAILITASR